MTSAVLGKLRFESTTWLIIAAVALDAVVAIVLYLDWARIA